MSGAGSGSGISRRDLMAIGGAAAGLAAMTPLAQARMLPAEMDRDAFFQHIRSQRRPA